MGTSIGLCLQLSGTKNTQTYYISVNCGPAALTKAAASTAAVEITAAPPFLLLLFPGLLIPKLLELLKVAVQLPHQILRGMAQIPLRLLNPIAKLLHWVPRKAPGPPGGSLEKWLCTLDHALDERESDFVSAELELLRISILLV